MIVDTSAIIAILLWEPERDALLGKLASDQVRLISAVSLLEAGVVLRARKGNEGLRLLSALLTELDLDIILFDELQAQIATDAYSRFGKGLGSKASLNICDCATYALAKVKRQPLLAVGRDFFHTDARVL